MPGNSEAILATSSEPSSKSAAHLAATDAAANAAADVMKVWLRFVRLNRRLYAAIASELRGIGLSVPQFDVLSTLSEREGLSQQELADRLYVTKGNVSGLVDRLVRSGLAERRTLPGDRRSHALYLTENGRVVVAQGLAIQRAYVDRTLGQLPATDIAALDRIQRAWRSALDDRNHS